jgi:hypothetical protein
MRHLIICREYPPPDRSRIRTTDSGDQTQQCKPSRSIRTDHSNHATRCNAEADVPESPKSFPRL